jgi:glycosyltransferase involved in cell wall biosynthesis
MPSRSSRTVRVAAFLPYPTGRVPGQRFRIEQWAPGLRDKGIEIVFFSFLTAETLDVLYQPGHVWQKFGGTIRGCVRRLREIRNLDGFDVAYVYREAALAGPTWIERSIARRIPIVFDFDDAIYLPATSGANPLAAFLKNGEKPAAICKLARHVLVGNDILAEFARQHCHAVTVVPTTIDTNIYVPRERPPNPRPVVGWTGSTTTVPYLKEILPALVALRRRLDYEVHVVGGSVEIPGVDVRCLPWRAGTETEDLQRFDVGLMPLPDDPWSRGKCGLKALQYMALGIPPVVSPVGVNASIVSDGINGLHARSVEEWVDRIAALLLDTGLRSRLGVAARRTVEESYSTRSQEPRIARVLHWAAALTKPGTSPPPMPLHADS